MDEIREVIHKIYEETGVYPSSIVISEAQWDAMSPEWESRCTFPDVSGVVTVDGVRVTWSR